MLAKTLEQNVCSRFKISTQNIPEITFLKKKKIFCDAQFCVCSLSSVLSLICIWLILLGLLSCTLLLFLNFSLLFYY